MISDKENNIRNKYIKLQKDIGDMIKVKVLVDTKLCKKDEIISIPPEYIDGLVRSGYVEVIDKTITKTKSGYVKK